MVTLSATYGTGGIRHRAEAGGAARAPARRPVDPGPGQHRCADGRGEPHQQGARSGPWAPVAGPPRPLGPGDEPADARCAGPAGPAPRPGRREHRGPARTGRRRVGGPGGRGRPGRPPGRPPRAPGRPGSAPHRAGQRHREHRHGDGSRPVARDRQRPVPLRAAAVRTRPRRQRSTTSSSTRPCCPSTRWWSWWPRRRRRSGGRARDHPSTVAAADAAYERRWWTLAVLCLSLIVIGVDNTILNVALPSIVRGPRRRGSELQWIIDAYTIVFACLLLTAGALGDKFGRKGTSPRRSCCSAAFSAARVARHFAHELIVARALMGIGGAFIFPTTLSILTNMFHGPASGPGHRHLGRRLRARHRDRPARPAGCWSSTSVGLGLPRQRPDLHRWPSCSGASSSRPRGSARTDPSTPSARCCRSSRLVGAALRHHRGARTRVDVARVVAAFASALAFLGAVRLVGDAPGTRCSTCASSATRASAPRRRRSRSPTSRCSARRSCSPSTSSSCSATRRSRPGC